MLPVDAEFIFLSVLEKVSGNFWSKFSLSALRHSSILVLRTDNKILFFVHCLIYEFILG